MAGLLKEDVQVAVVVVKGVLFDVSVAPAYVPAYEPLPSDKARAYHDADEFVLVCTS